MSRRLKRRSPATCGASAHHTSILWPRMLWQQAHNMGQAELAESCRMLLPARARQASAEFPGPALTPQSMVGAQPLHRVSADPGRVQSVRQGRPQRIHRGGHCRQQGRKRPQQQWHKRTRRRQRTWWRQRTPWRIHKRRRAQPQQWAREQREADEREEQRQGGGPCRLAVPSGSPALQAGGTLSTRPQARVLHNCPGPDAGRTAPPGRCAPAAGCPATAASRRLMAR